MENWHGKEYRIRGEEQLIEYLDNHGIDKGYIPGRILSPAKCDRYPSDADIVCQKPVFKREKSVWGGFLA